MQIEHERRQVERLNEDLRIARETISDLESRTRSYMLLVRQQQAEAAGAVVSSSALVPASGSSISASALSDVRAAFAAECSSIRADHEDLRAVLQQVRSAPSLCTISPPKIQTPSSYISICHVRTCIARYNNPAGSN